MSTCVLARTCVNQSTNKDNKKHELKKKILHILLLVYFLFPYAQTSDLRRETLTPEVISFKLQQSVDVIQVVQKQNVLPILKKNRKQVKNEEENTCPIQRIETATVAKFVA